MPIAPVSTRYRNRLDNAAIRRRTVLGLEKATSKAGTPAEDSLLARSSIFPTSSLPAP